MSRVSTQARRTFAAMVATLVALAVASPLHAQGMYLKEVVKDGTIYVFNSAENAERFEQTGEMTNAITMTGVGPNGETVIGDSEKALQLYFFRHNLAVVVPDAPAPAPAPQPWRISGLVFGDYYWFAKNHSSQWEDQHGLWMRRAYFTFDYTFSPKIGDLPGEYAFVGAYTSKDTLAFAVEDLDVANLLVPRTGVEIPGALDPTVRHLVRVPEDDDVEPPVEEPVGCLHLGPRAFALAPPGCGRALLGAPPAGARVDRVLERIELRWDAGDFE